MDKQIHHIKKYVFELKVKNKNNFFEIRKKINSAYNYKILQTLDAVFNEYFTGDKVVMIEKLEIDLGKISEDEIENNLASKIKQRLIAQLDERMGELSTSGKTKLVTPEGKIVQAPAFENNNNSDDKTLDQEDFILKVISYFLKTGTIPWYGQGQIRNIEHEINSLISTQPEKTRRILSENISSDIVKERLAKQFSDETVIKIACLYNPDINGIIRQWFDEIQFIPKKYLTDKSGIVFLNYILRLTIIELIGNDLIIHISDKIILQYFIRLLLNKAIKPEEVIKNLNSAVVDMKKEGYLFTISSLFPLILKNVLSNNRTNFSFIPNKSSFGSKESAEEAGYYYESVNNEIPEATGKDKIKTPPYNDIRMAEENSPKNKELEIFDNDITINNSGLILLSPFLKLFFENLHMLEKDNFSDRGEQIKAVHLLQYLADGTENNFEHLLTLNKLLCGLDISFPVAREITLSETEKYECNELLLSVIRHWSALKNISVNGLRESFLMRNGLLESDDAKALLRVEQKAFDMLLNKIPWSFSIVNLPWMEKKLYVEWQRL